MSREVARRRDGVITKMRDPRFLAQMRDLMPESMRRDPGRVVVQVQQAININPTLLECSEPSLFLATATACSLKLDIGGPLGESYLLPRRVRGEQVAQFQVGWRGYLKLAYRSGEVLSVDARTVDLGDEFSYEYGLEPRLTHRPGPVPTGGWSHVYATAHLRAGGRTFDVMSKEECEIFRDEHRSDKGASAKAKQYGPWTKHFAEMSRKTVLVRLLRRLPLSVELLRQAEENDERTFEIKGGEPISAPEEDGGWEMATGPVDDQGEAEPVEGANDATDQ